MEFLHLSVLVFLQGGLSQIGRLLKMGKLKRLFARRWWLAVITIMALIHPLHYLLAYWNTPPGYRFVGGGMVEDFIYYPLMKFWEGHYQNPWAEEEIDSIFYSNPFVYIPMGYVAKLLGGNYVLVRHVSDSLFSFLYLLMVYYVLKRFSSSSREHNLSFLFFTLLNGLGGFIYLIYRLFTDPARMAIPTKPFAGMKQVITYEFTQEGIPPLTHLGRLYHLVPLFLGFTVLYLFFTRDYRKTGNTLLTGILWGATILFGGPNFAFGFGIILCLYAFSRWDMQAIKSLLAIMFMGALLLIPWYYYVTGDNAFFNYYRSLRHHVMPWAVAVSIGPHVATSLYHIGTKAGLKHRRLSFGERSAILLTLGSSVFLVFYGLSFLRDLGNLTYQYLSFLPVLILAAHLVGTRLNAARALERFRSDKDFIFLCLWAFTMFVTSVWYAKFAFWFPARHLFFLWFPIAALSAKGVTGLVKRYDTIGSRKLFKKIVVVFVILTFPSFIFYNVVFAYQWTQGPSNKLLYATAGDFHAMQFLATQPPGRVLSALKTGGYLSFYTNHRALVWDESRRHLTTNFNAKKEGVARFYSGQMTEEQMYKFLTGYDLVYVFLGANEKELGNGKLDLESVPFLKQGYDNGETQVFKFIQRN